MIQRACAISESEGNESLYIYLDTLTLALAQHMTGDTASAIETQRRAIEMLPEDAADRQHYLDALQRYEQSGPP